MSGALALTAAESAADYVFLNPVNYYRAIGPEAPGSGSLQGVVFIADVTEREEHRDQLYITEHPVEVGASISDHAYKRPAEVQLRLGWSNSSHQDPYAIQSIYAMLLRLQSDRTPFNLYTGKRAYFNMLLAGMVVETDQSTEYVLRVDASLRQILLTQTQIYTISTNSNNLKNPQTALPTQNQGSKVLQPSSNLSRNSAGFQQGGALYGVSSSNSGQFPLASATGTTSINPSNPASAVVSNN